MAGGGSDDRKINGILYSAEQTKGYLAISRAWQDSDEIELHLPLAVWVSRLPDNKNVVAFSYGPVVLCTCFGTEQWWLSPIGLVKATTPDGVKIKDYIVLQHDPIEHWLDNINNNLVKTPGKLEFTLRGTDEDDNFKFKPYYREYKERYGIYFRLLTSGSRS